MFCGADTIPGRLEKAKALAAHAEAPGHIFRRDRLAMCPGSPQKLLKEAQEGLPCYQEILLTPRVILSYCLEVWTLSNAPLTNSSGSSPTGGYLNWPENDVHVPVDTLKRVHGAAAPRGDGKQGLLVLKEKTSVPGLLSWVPVS